MDSLYSFLGTLPWFDWCPPQMSKINFPLAFCPTGSLSHSSRAVRIAFPSTHCEALFPEISTRCVALRGCKCLLKRGGSVWIFAFYFTVCHSGGGQHGQREAGDLQRRAVQDVGSWGKTQHISVSHTDYTGVCVSLRLTLSNIHCWGLVVQNRGREQSYGFIVLCTLLHPQDLRKAAVLIFANKQDMKDCMSAAEISKYLSLSSIKDHPWHIQSCCALTGEG